MATYQERLQAVHERALMERQMQAERLEKTITRITQAILEKQEAQLLRKKPTNVFPLAMAICFGIGFMCVVFSLKSALTALTKSH